MYQNKVNITTKLTILIKYLIAQTKLIIANSCDGRVVKAFDSKSNGLCPRRFESYSQRKKICLLQEMGWKHIDKLISETLNTFFCLGETIL